MTIMQVDMRAKTETVDLMPRKPAKARRKQLSTSLIFMAPAFLIILVFMLGPALWSVYISFTNMALTGIGANAISWVGFQNFAHIFSDGEFLNSLRVSLTYLVF